MTILVGDYEVKISARNTQYEDKASAATTKRFLNEVSTAFFETADRYDRVGCFAIGKRAREQARAIFNELDKRGYFKDVH